MLKCKTITIALCLVVLASSCYSSERINVIRDKRTAYTLLKHLSNDYSFFLDNESRLPSGSRYKMVQLYRGLWVRNTVIVSKSNNVAEFHEEDLISGEFLINIEDDITSIEASIDRGAAIALATAPYKDSNIPIKNINSRLVIKAYDRVATLVYMIDYFVDETVPKRPFYIIDAHTGVTKEYWEGLPTNN